LGDVGEFSDPLLLSPSPTYYLPTDIPFQSTPVVPHSVNATFDLDQKVLEALSRSGYVSDDDEVSEMSELSESDSDNEDPSSQPHAVSRQMQDDEATTQGNQAVLTRAAKRTARSREAAKRNKKQKKIKARSENQAVTRAAKRMARSREAAKRNKKQKKIKARSENQPRDPQLANRHIQNAQPVALSYNSERLNISARGYIGKGSNGDERMYWLDEVVGEGSMLKFGLKKWDGRLVRIKYSVE
jgi:hypothetical protein